MRRVVVLPPGSNHVHLHRCALSMEQLEGFLPRSTLRTKQADSESMPIHPATSSFMPSPRTTRSPREVLVPANSEGAILAAIALLISRTIRGKIVDYIGTGIASVSVIARHHEPRNRIPRVLRNESSSSDESGEFVLCNVGLDFAPYVDSIAPSYPRSHSTLLALEVDETWIGRIGPKEPQAMVVVRVVERSGQPFAGVPTFLCAETSHFIPWARSSWLIRQGLTQSLLASRFGSARFTGVPPGAFTIGAKPATISLERAVVAVAIQEVSPTLVDPQ